MKLLIDSWMNDEKNYTGIRLTCAFVERPICPRRRRERQGLIDSELDDEENDEANGLIDSEHDDEEKNDKRGLRTRTTVCIYASIFATRN